MIYYADGVMLVVIMFVSSEPLHILYYPFSFRKKIANFVDVAIVLFLL